MLKSKGFFIVDLLLSLSAWTLISLTILPMGIQLLVAISEERHAYKATIILYENLNNYIIEGKKPVSQNFMVDNWKYELIPRLDLKEVCVHFENHLKQEKKVCDFLE